MFQVRSVSTNQCSSPFVVTILWFIWFKCGVVHCFTSIAAGVDRSRVWVQSALLSTTAHPPWSSSRMVIFWSLLIDVRALISSMLVQTFCTGKAAEPFRPAACKLLLQRAYCVAGFRFATGTFNYSHSKVSFQFRGRILQSLICCISKGYFKCVRPSPGNDPMYPRIHSEM